MLQAEREGMLILHDPVPAFCPAETCLAQAGGEVLFFDSSHVSQAGAELLLDALPELPY